MKVAIIGAGTSGLACAIELKKHGVAPTIYEKKSELGDLYCVMCTHMRVANNTYGDIFKKIYKKYGIELLYRYKLKNIIMKSANNTSTVSGNLGYIVSKGISQPDNICKQLGRLANLPIQFDTFVEMDDIKYEFDHIVVATGRETIAEKMGNWIEKFTAQYTTATVLGKFAKDTMLFWSNTEYSKNSFAYLIPINDKTANVVLVVDNIKPSEMDYYWNKFIATENLQFETVERKNDTHTCGNVNEFKTKDNVYFVGNSGGFTDSFLGFGMFYSIQSGVAAARCICQKRDYSKIAANIIKPINKMHQYRELVNTFSNKNYDQLLTLLNIPGIKQVTYNNPFFKLRSMAPFIKMINKIR